MSDRKTCASCSGNGICRYCYGSGWRYVAFNGRAKRETCTACSGIGACAPCEGRGSVHREFDDAYVL